MASFRDGRRGHNFPSRAWRAPTGGFVVTAAFKDGTHKTLKVPAGM
jgi:hypothetical protein